MGVLKNDELKVEEFSFQSLIPDQAQGDKNEEFVFRSLDRVQEFQNGITEDDLRAERSAARETSFKFMDAVHKLRGLSRQEKEDYERRVSDEVERRLAELTEQGYQEGLARGMEEGKAQAHAEAKEELSAKIDEFTQHIAETKPQIDSILHESKLDAYNIIKNLSKWIVLKEVDEKYYLARLLERLIHEINQRTNIVLHVNESAFGYMPEIIKIVERKVGKLNNVRVEVDLDQTHNGLKLETENAIIDASLEAQFGALDSLFKVVGLNASR